MPESPSVKTLSNRLTVSAFLAAHYLGTEWPVFWPKFDTFSSFWRVSDRCRRCGIDVWPRCAYHAGTIDSQSEI